MSGINAVICETGRIFETTYYSFRISKERYHPFVSAPFGAKRGEKPLTDIAKNDGYLLAINAGLFNPLPHTHEPEGIIIQNGEVVQNSRAVFYPDSMPLTIDSNGRLWYADCKADANELVKAGIIHAVCGFMPIVIDGVAVPREKWTCVPHYDLPHLRQIIGQYANGDYAVITCEGRGYAKSTGWTIEDAQRVCMVHGLWFAYNLDGGTSTETVCMGKQVTETHARAADRFAPTFIVF